LISNGRQSDLNQDCQRNDGNPEQEEIINDRVDGFDPANVDVNG